MAEEKIGQETNPPHDQPNDQPLPRTYNQLLGTNNPTKTSWPELVNVIAEEAERKIKEEKPGAEIQVVPPNSFVTCDYRTNRVRLYVDEVNKRKNKDKEGTNPPQDQPNDQPLPRTYNQLLGTNNPTKISWPELVNVTAEEAERKIKEEKPRVEIQVVPPNSCVTFDYRTNRVRLYVDEFNKVISTPTIG